jgi:CRP-like cAMP-binding protein
MPIPLDTLKVLPLFADLTREESSLVIQVSRLRNMQRGQLLFMHGDKVKHFYVICRGTVQIFRETPDGHELTSDILISGDSIGADEVVQAKHTHLANARAVDNVALLEIPISWMKEHLTNFDQLAPKLLADIATRLHNTQIEAEHLSTMNAAQIVACYLQKLCVLYNFDPHGFELPYSKTLIASRLHMELETFSRTLQKLKDHGIAVNGTNVSFTNAHKASSYACDHCSASADCSTHQQLYEKLREHAPKQG